MAKRVLCAFGTLFLGAAVGRLALLLASPICGSEGDSVRGGKSPPANLTEALPPDLRMWALSSPSYLAEQYSQQYSDDQWASDGPWISYAYLPAWGRTIFIGEDRARGWGSPEPVYLAKDEVPPGSPPRVLASMWSTRVRPPDRSPPSFLVVDNRTACFLYLCRNARACLACSDGASVRTSPTPIQVMASAPPMLHGGRVWMKKDTANRGLHMIYAVDPWTMEEDYRGSFHTAFDDFTNRYLLSSGYDGVFVRGCKRPQLGVGLFAGGMCALGVSLWVWARVAMPFVAYSGLTAAVYGVLSIATADDAWGNGDPDDWYISKTGWMIANYGDRWRMSGWLILSASAMLVSWYRWASPLRIPAPGDPARHHPDQTRALRSLRFGTVAYFCGWLLLCADDFPLLFLFLCSVPLLGLAVASGHLLPSALSGLGTLLTSQGWGGASYESNVAGWGLALLTLWWTLHRHAPAACFHPAVRSALFWAGCGSHFALSLLNLGEGSDVVPFVLLSVLPLLVVGLWTGHSLPLALVVAGLGLAFAALLTHALDRLDDVFHHMTDVVEGLWGLLVACAALAVAGLAVCGARGAVRDRTDLSARLRAWMRRLGLWGRRPLPSLVELAPFFEAGEEDHDL